MLGTGDKKKPPHRRALLFVDNSGADIVLGMLPLARELLRRGTEVSSFSSFYILENLKFLYKILCLILSILLSEI